MGSPFFFTVIMRNGNYYLKTLFFSFFVMGTFVLQPWPADAKLKQYQIDVKNSQLKGDVRYVVLGRYHARFEQFSGAFSIDEDNLQNCYVELDVSLNSLKSKHPRLDKIVKSPRLLDATKYPVIKFRSTSFLRRARTIFVSGNLSVHGVTQIIEFPIDILRPQDSQNTIVISGKWSINRKDFGIVFHKVLDKGGILVSDYVNVEWEIVGKTFD